MQMKTDTPALGTRRDKAVVCLYEKLLRLDDDQWERAPLERLKTYSRPIYKSDWRGEEKAGAIPPPHLLQSVRLLCRTEREW
jgi:hypothetical protein